MACFPKRSLPVLFDDGKSFAVGVLSFAALRSEPDQLRRLDFTAFIECIVVPID
jgi:hypothetical protein